MAINHRALSAPGVHGTARDHPLPRPRKAYDFGRAESLVRWVLNEGRERMEGVKAIEYERHGSQKPIRNRWDRMHVKAGHQSRDLDQVAAMHARYAFALKAMSVLTEEQRDLLVLAYRGADDATPREAQDHMAGRTNLTGPLSDEQIAIRLGGSAEGRRTICRRRHQALRLVAARAQALKVIPGGEANDTEDEVTPDPDAGCTEAERDRRTTHRHLEDLKRRAS